MNAEISGVELFDAPPVTRRALASDFIRLGVGLIVVIVGFVLATVAEGTVGGVESDVVEGVSSLPRWIEQTVLVASQFFAVLAPIAIIFFLLLRRQWATIMALFVGAGVGSIAITTLNRALPARETVAVLERLAVNDQLLAGSGFPSPGYLAGAVALVTIGAPWLSRRWKRFAWAWIGALVFTRILVANQPMLDLVLAIGVGMVAGSVLLVVFGSPSTEPRPDELLAGLRAVGLEPVKVERRRSGDSPNYWVTERDGRELMLKVRTPNDRSADLLNRFWRSIRFRSSEVDLPFSSITRRIEHEALLLVLAERAGVSAPQVDRIGLTEGESAFLAVERLSGRVLSELEPSEIDGALMEAIWLEVGKLHRANIAHRHLALQNIMVSDAGEVWLTDFDRAVSTATELQLGRDVAELLVGLSAAVGAAATVASAVSIVEQVDLESAFRSLQPLALSDATRASLEGHGELLDDIRTELVRQGDLKALEPLRLERIKPKTVVMVLAATLAFYSLLPQFGALDDTLSAFRSAELGWIVLLLLASMASYGFATIAFLGSVARMLPVPASFRVQVASSFASLVGPSSTGQMALTGRFLQGAGLSAGDASAAVLLDTVAGLIGHIILMVVFFAWTGQQGLGSFSLPDANAVLLIVTIVGIVVGVALLFRPVRRAVVTRLAQGLRDAGSHIIAVLRSPGRVSALIGGSIGISLAYIAALVCAVEAFGGGLSVAQTGTAFLGAAIIATVAPTPGGLGAFEAAMVAALTGFGLNDGVAISSVLTYRLATFWLPIIPGWFTFHWMQRNEEI